MVLSWYPISLTSCIQYSFDPATLSNAAFKSNVRFCHSPLYTGVICAICLAPLVGVGPLNLITYVAAADASSPDLLSLLMVLLVLVFLLLILLV